MKKEKISTGKVNTAEFKSLFSKVHLGGLLSEAVVRVREESLSTEANDLTSSLFVVCNVGIKLDCSDKKLGFGDLGLMIRFLDTVPTETISIKKKNNTLSMFSKTFKFQYMMSDPEVIPTVVEEHGIGKKLLERTKYEVILEKEVADRLVKYLNLLKLKVVEISVKDGELLLRGGTNSNFHSFSIKVGNIGKEKSFDFCVYADHFVAILQVINWEKDKVVLKFGSGTAAPFIVYLGDENFWALLTISPNEDDNIPNTKEDEEE